MPRTLLLGGIVLLAAPAIAAVSCSASQDPQGTGASGGSGGGGGAGGTGDGGGFINPDGGGECGGVISCSPNQTQVLCDGQVIKTCPPGQACAGGDCAEACEAARINKSTVGCDYHAVNPDVTFSQGACYAVFVANTWSEPVDIFVERSGTSFDLSGFARIPSGAGQSLTYAPLPGGKLPPGEIAILFLAQHGPDALYTPACPAGVTPAFTSADAALHGTGIGASFNIKTSAPVVAYDIFPYGGGRSAITSATLLLPVTAWGTNYIGVNPYRHTLGAADFYSWLQLVASEDDTQVTINPTAAIVGGPGVAATGAGQPVTYELQRGQVLQITQDAVLTGSPIQSNRPVGLIGGNRCMVIPANAFACDAGHQMIPPVQALGHEYAAVRYRNRIDGLEESPPWRIVGAIEGTQLTYEPAPPPGAPTLLGSGQEVEFSAPGPFIVRSQDKDHPFYMSAHMTGCSEIGGSGGDCRGDPETVNVIPTAQFLSSYVFFTDPTYPETNLLFIRKRGQSGFEDVTLDCAGVLTGWQPIGSGGELEYTRVDLVRGNFQPQGACDNGRREAKSDAPFGVTVWGWGSAVTAGDIADPGVSGFYTQAVSYAYPAGAGVQIITEVDVPPVPR